jgi:putative tryptophan/tyrosine transport system substrate-binding protein
MSAGRGSPPTPASGLPGPFYGWRASLAARASPLAREVLMRRREAIAAVGAALAYPLAGVAQQSPRPVVGFLGPRFDTRQHWLAAFRRGLASQGFVEGQNVSIDYRSADREEHLPELAAEFVRLPVATIFAAGPPAALAAKRSTQTIPIVFVSGGDPVQMGLVSSFHRPDGNATGFYYLATELVAKRLVLLKELLPRAKRVAVLVNPASAATAEQTSLAAGAAASALDLDVRLLNARTSGEIDSAFRGVASWAPDALLVGPDPLFNTERAHVVMLAARHALPASYFQRDQWRPVVS